MPDSPERQQKGTERRSPDLVVVAAANAFKTANIGIKYGFPSWAVVKSITVLAGKRTTASFVVELLRSNHVVYLILIGLSIMLLVWGLGERALRQMKTAELQGRIRKLEMRIDPQRSTSGLTRRGTTNPDDLT